MATRPTSRTRGFEVPPTAHLPVYLTPLVGRSRELDEVTAWIRTSRLVSLVGPGGIGKTRLAAAAAAALRDRSREPVAWIDLSTRSDPGHVACHVAAALGLREQPGRTAVQSLLDLLGEGPALLVLDNCEHLLDGCSELALALLRGAPGVRILTTSRQALGVAGEKAWMVPPLALPAADGGTVAEAGAVQLFVQRANDALPSFALTEANADAVARICRRLDGLPLAIELAAARVRLLPPEQLASRLDGVFGLLSSSSRVALPRHRTLRALIDWSYDLLSPPERLLFERLGAFAGGFTLEAAERVVSDGVLPAGEVLDLLAALVDRSLVGMRDWHGEARYSLLETVREYACERLSGGEAELRRRHVGHFAAVAEEAALHLHRSGQLEWLSRLDAEQENLRAALAWSVAAGEAETVLRLCVALRDYWRLRGHLTEARRWHAEALRLSPGPSPLRARALVGAAAFARMQGDHHSYLDGLRESAGSGERRARAEALTQLGIALRDAGEVAAALESLDDAVALGREIGDPWGLTQALSARSTIAVAMGELAVGRALRLEAVEVSRRAGDREGQARALIGLGEIARREGDYEGARAYNERCLPFFREFGDSWHVAAVHHNLGWIAAETGEVEEAFRAFSEGGALFARAGAPFGMTLCLAGLGLVLHQSGDPESALTAILVADREAERVRMRPVPADAASWDRARAEAEAALCPERAARARARAAGMEPAECLAWARERVEALRPSPLAAASPAERAECCPRPAPGPVVEPDLRVSALGPLRILTGGKPLEGDAFGSSKPRELLLLLLAHPEGLTREQVGLAFWPESSAAQVKNSFHVTLHRLRKALERPEWIVAAGERYRLDPALRVEVDAARFEAETEAALRDADGERLAAALDLYRGDFLEGEPAGDWHLEIRDRLRRLYLRGLLARAAALMEEERHAEAATALRSLLARDPLHEEGYRRLMLCLSRQGERVEALRLYDSLSHLLRDELDTDPEEETTDLYDRLRLAAR